MKLKRVLVPIFIILLTLMTVTCFTACDDEHTHSFSEWTTITEASCSTPGVKVRNCSCGHSEHDTIAQLPHTEEVDAAVPATCIAKGKTEGSHCSVCNTTIVVQTEIPALGHTTIVDEAVAPTCTTSGSTEGSHCDVCGDVLQHAEVIQPLQHACDNVSIIETATCIKSGTKRYSCTRENCNYYYDETYLLQEYSSTEIYNQALNYVGEIITYKENGMPLAQGTGFVATADGRIITNYHVIEGAYSASITIGEDTYTIQSVLAFDADIDLAVLKIDANNLIPANICKNDPVIAETVYAIGSPKGMTASVSVGIVSYNKRVIDGVTYVQHDAVITHGSSGSPLINKYGEVIGINKGAYGGVLNVAVFTSELDNLVYGTPITLAELYDLEHTANDVLTEWLLGNYNYAIENVYYYQLEGNCFTYSLAYDATEKYNFIEGYWYFDDGATLYLSIDLSEKTDGKYSYYAHYTYDTNENYTHGYIDCSTYTPETILTCYNFVGEYWDKDSMLEYYSSAVAIVMEWFDYCVENYIDELAVEDFGFDALTFQYNDKAYSILCDYIKANGIYDEESQNYGIEEKIKSTTGTVILGIEYSEDTGVVYGHMMWVGTDWSYYTIYIDFNKGASGNFYGCTYYLSTSSESNMVEGYIDAGAFTSKSALTYYSFRGMDSYKSQLLDIYSYGMQEVLNWVGALLDEGEVGITLADLGFVFYDGYVPVQECDGDAHFYLSPTFEWVEDSNGFTVTATFPCNCGKTSQTATTYVLNSDYNVTTSADETEIVYEFTASVVFGGYTYTDTRYIKYEWIDVTLNNYNYEDYLTIGCYNSSYLITTTVLKKPGNLTYSNVSVTFNVSMSGTISNGSNTSGYSKTQTIQSGIEQKFTSAQAVSGLPNYLFTPTSLTYTVSVTGHVSGYIRTAYLTQ